MRKHHLSLRSFTVPAVLILSLFCAGAASAHVFMVDYEVEARLSRQLIQMNMFDYANYHLELMQKKFSDKKDVITILYGRMYAEEGKRKQAVEKFASIKRSSSFFPEACMARARYARDPAERKKAYDDYFAVFKKAPNSQEGVDEFVEAIVRYVGLLRREGETAKAAKVLEKLKLLPKDKQIDNRMFVILSAQTRLGAMDAKKEKKEAINKGEVNAVLKELQDLQWVLDYPCALSYFESAHAHVLLDQPDEAIKILSTGSKFLSDMEKSVEEQTGSLAASPMAGANFYLAEAYLSRARTYRKTDEEKMKDGLVKAAQKFYKVTLDYKNSAFETKATARLDYVKRILAKYDLDFKISKGEEQRMKLDAAHAQFTQKKYARAAELYLEGASYRMTGKIVPECLYYATVCLYKTQKYLDALAVADFMGDYMRGSEHTHNALYNLAVTLWKEGRKLEKAGDAAGALAYKDDAIDMFGKFARLAPTHSKAAAAAYRVAEYQYAKGSALNKQKKELIKQKKPQKEINDAILAMRAAFNEAVPLYEVLTANYGGTDQGVKAAYKLAWIYHISGDKEKAAEQFLLYCDVQVRPVPERALAKFFAAEQYMRLERADDAIEHFRELLDKWLVKDGEYEETDKIAKYRQNGKAMLPWCVDMKSNQLKAKAKEYQEQLDALTAKPEEGAAAEEAAKPEDAKPEEKAAAPEAEKKEEVAEAAPAEDAKKDKADGAAEGEEAKDGEQEPYVGPELTAEELTAKVKELTDESKTLRDEARTLFNAYLTTYPKDKGQVPSIMVKLGAMEFEDEKFEEGTKWFERLNAEFPDTPAGEQSAFLLGRAYCKIQNWEKANETLKKMIPKLDTYPIGNISYIAKLLWEDDSKQARALDVELVMAANEALIKLAADETHKDRNKLLKMRNKALFRRAECLLVLERNDEALAIYDQMLQESEMEKKKNPKAKESAYYFDIYFNKGIAFRKMKRIPDSIRSFENILGHINNKTLPGKYYRAVCEVGHSMSLSDDERLVKQSVARFMQIVNFADGSNPEVAPWLEEATYRAAVSASLIGDSEKADEFRQKYLGKYNKGRFRQQIMSLPSKKSFGGAAPAPAAAAGAPEAAPAQ